MKMWMVHVMLTVDSTLQSLFIFMFSVTHTVIKQEAKYNSSGDIDVITYRCSGVRLIYQLYPNKKDPVDTM